MITKDTVYVFTPTKTKSTEGIVINTYAYADTLYLDVQPAQLTQAQLQTYGLTVQAANAKKIFVGNDRTMSLLERIVYNDIWYEIRGQNTWPTHQELILAPVQSAITYVFMASNITIAPTAGAFYTNNNKSFCVTSTVLTLAGGKYLGTITCTSNGLPVFTTGYLTKTSGTGDSSILFSSFTSGNT